MTWTTKMQATFKQQWLKSQNDDLCNCKQYKKNLLEGTKQQRTRIITKSNLKKSFEDNRHVLKQRCDNNRQKKSSLETLNSYTLKNNKNWDFKIILI
jgi:hypothetical protein